MKKVNHIFIILAGIVSLTSCASFSSKIVQENTEKLTKATIHAIEGTYELKPFESYYEEGKKILKLGASGHRTMDNFILTKHIPRAISNNYVVDIKVVSDTKLQFTFRDQDVVLNKVYVNAKLKKNGLLHLDTKNVAITGIPYVFGNLDITKSRVGLSKSGDFFINHVNHSSNGIFIILSEGYTSNTCHYYKKIQPSS